jgi:hypothetical protein
MIQSRSWIDDIFQRGFAKTSELILKWKFSGPWLDKASFWEKNSEGPTGENLFFFSTHSSWLDPMAAVFLAVQKMKLKVIAPIEAAQLEKYRSLHKVGLFPVKKGDGPEIEKQLSQFLLKHPQTAVWITPQGAFAPNELPQPEFKQGLSRWSNLAGVKRVPVAMHYHFGADTKPGLFFRLGTPVEGGKLSLEEDREMLRGLLEAETRALLNTVWIANSGSKFDSSSFHRL